MSVRWAESRDTEIASLLENYLDDNQETISPKTFTELNAMAGVIDKKVKEKDERIQELESEDSE